MSFRTGPAIALSIGALLLSGRSESAVLVPHAQARSGEKVLHQFRGGADGLEPSGNLIAAANGDLFGMTQAGGPNSDGIVFALTLGAKGASERIIYRFRGGSDGEDPQAALLAGANGTLFGTTTGGGDISCSGGCGTAFELVPSGTSYVERVIHSFAETTGDGIAPEDTLADGNGALFGTTSFGGAGNAGIVFELQPSGTGFAETILHTFQLQKGDGEYPQAGVIIDASGALYGTTPLGGTGTCGEGCGAVYMLKPSGTNYRERVIYSFNGSPDGEVPSAGLLADGSGALYGTTTLGGIVSSDCPTGCGTVFKLRPAPGGYTEEILHSFAGASDGIGPQSGLTAAANEVLYGTTQYGGAGGLGTIYSLTPSSNGYAERVVLSFQSGDDGANPTAGLLAGSNGELYGTTVAGGRFPCGSFGGCGVAYALKPAR